MACIVLTQRVPFFNIQCRLYCKCYSYMVVPGVNSHIVIDGSASLGAFQYVLLASPKCCIPQMPSFCSTSLLYEYLMGSINFIKPLSTFIKPPLLRNLSNMKNENLGYTKNRTWGQLAEKGDRYVCAMRPLLGCYLYLSISQVKCQLSTCCFYLVLFQPLVRC